mmetsp:Transcript_11797/g.33312  ORF Transcript_11797/g.33312 Transcript_11797/m.33312 type:complete len:165 (-) Transcript_11797:155-649(-)
MACDMLRVSWQTPDSCGELRQEACCSYDDSQTLQRARDNRHPCCSSDDKKLQIRRMKRREVYLSRCQPHRAEAVQNMLDTFLLNEDQVMHLEYMEDHHSPSSSNVQWPLWPKSLTTQGDSDWQTATRRKRSRQSDICMLPIARDSMSPDGLPCSYPPSLSSLRC